MIAESRNKICEKLVVTVAPLRVILDREGEGIIAEPDLLDDVIGRAPGFDLEAVSEFIEGLVVRTVDLFEPMRRGPVGAERLDIVLLHFRRVVTGNVEVESAAERDVEELHALADREDRQLSLQRVFRCGKFPAVAVRLHVGIENGRIGHRLMEKLRGNVRAAAQKESLHFLHRHLLGAGVPKPHIWMFRERAPKEGVVFFADPGGDMRHGPTLRPFISVVNSSPPMMNDQDITERLGQACERILSESKAVAYAVALHDYESGVRLMINADRCFHAASTMKVAILLAVGRALDEKRLEPDETLHVRNRFRSAIDGAPFRIDAESDGYPQLHRLVGRTAKISDLAEWMIVSSSNLATNLLLDYLTVDYVRGVLDAAGVKGIDLRRGVDDTKAHERNFNNETTAQGLLDLFAALRGDFLSKASRERAINILLQQRFNSMIPAPLPAHASVAHKTGEISTACHDAGIVYLPERNPYILVVLTEVPAETNGRRETIAKVSEVVFQMLTGTEAKS